METQNSEYFIQDGYIRSKQNKYFKVCAGCNTIDSDDGWNPQCTCNSQTHVGASDLTLVDAPLKSEMTPDQLFVLF